MRVIKSLHFQLRYLTLQKKLSATKLGESSSFNYPNISKYIFRIQTWKIDENQEIRIIRKYNFFLQIVYFTRTEILSFFIIKCQLNLLQCCERITKKLQTFRLKRISPMAQYPRKKII